MSIGKLEDKLSVRTLYISPGKADNVKSGVNESVGPIIVCQLPDVFR